MAPSAALAPISEPPWALKLVPWLAVTVPAVELKLGAPGVPEPNAPLIVSEDVSAWPEVPTVAVPVNMPPLGVMLRWVGSTAPFFTVRLLALVRLASASVPAPAPYFSPPPCSVMAAVAV